MKIYKGKNIVSIVSSAVSGLLGIAILFMRTGTISNILGITLILISIIGFANYYKYSVIFENTELKVTTIFKAKRIRYKDIIKIYTVHTGRTDITYVIDKYQTKDRWYIRGTYPPQPVEQLKSAQYNNLSEIMSFNSYSFNRYKELLMDLSKKVGISCDIDAETRRIINS